MTKPKLDLDSAFEGALEIIASEIERLKEKSRCDEGLSPPDLYMLEALVRNAVMVDNRQTRRELQDDISELDPKEFDELARQAAVYVRSKSGG